MSEAVKMSKLKEEHLDNTAGEVKKQKILLAFQQKKEIEQKMQAVVERLLEDSIDKDFFKSCATFLEPRHYEDVVEERSVSKVCGYPLCQNKLTNFFKQRYHISMKSNKVFDLTERKKFCSNECYKASKYYKQQLSTSPVWTREKDTFRVTVTLLPIKPNEKGLEIALTGEEVIGPNTGLQNEVLGVANNLRKVSLSEKEEDILIPNGKSSVKNDGNDKQTVVAGCIEKQERATESVNHENTISGSSKHNNESSVSSDSPALDTTCTRKTKSTDTYIDLAHELETLESSNMLDLSSKIETTQQQRSIENFTDEVKGNTDINFGDVDETFNTNNNGLCSYFCTTKDFLHEQQNEFREDVQENDLTHVYTNSNVKSSKVTKQIKFLSHKSSEKNAKAQRKIKLLDISLQPLISGSFASSKQQNCSTKHVAVVEKLFTEYWCEDSLKFITGKDSLIEIPHDSQTDNTTVRCHDTVTQQSLLDSHNAEKPNLKKVELQEDVKCALIRVREYFKGNLNIPIGDLEKQDNQKETESFVGDNCSGDPILPLVDHHAQMTLRRRIVTENLNKCYEKIIHPLDLSIREIFAETRDLVKTFNLCSHNVTMLPSQWMIMSVVLLKVLSRKMPKLKSGLGTLKAQHYVDMLLNGEGATVSCVEAIVTSVLGEESKTDNLQEDISECPSTSMDMNVNIRYEDDEVLVDFITYDDELD